MSVFESEHTAQLQLGHPHIAEFDAWLAAADQDALATALAQRASFREPENDPRANTEVETTSGFVALNLDHLVAAEALMTTKDDNRRGQAEVEVTAKSSWIPAEQREKKRPRPKREPHFKAWKPPSQHTPVYLPIVAQEDALPMADACKNEDPQLFESKADSAIRAAKRICARCTTVIECRERAISQGDYQMTQGGMSATELKEHAKTLA